jgi:ABC-2 type transport system ATP-binding protein
VTSTDHPLSLDRLSKHFGRIHAVDDLSLTVESGQMVGFLGLNGAGKSTTMYMIVRLVRPTKGHIRIFGIDVWQDFKRAISQVGVMVESPAFYENLSARMNLRLAAGMRGKVDPDEIEEILDRIGLAARQHDKVQTFSTGMKQRLGLGRALLGHPRLLILDEPTNGLDPEGTREILSFLRTKIKEEGLTVFISSHLLYEVEEYCDTVHIIHEGRLAVSGQVQEILRPHEKVVKITFTGPSPDPVLLAQRSEIAALKKLHGNDYEVTLAQHDPAWLIQFLLEAGYRVSALEPKRKSLKEFFLSVTGGSGHA